MFSDNSALPPPNLYKVFYVFMVDENVSLKSSISDKEVKGVTLVYLQKLLSCEKTLERSIITRKIITLKTGFYHIPGQNGGLAKLAVLSKLFDGLLIIFFVAKALFG